MLALILEYCFPLPSAACSRLECIIAGVDCVDVGLVDSKIDTGNSDTYWTVDTHTVVKIYMYPLLRGFKMSAHSIQVSYAYKFTCIWRCR